MLQNSRVTALIVFELLREKQLGEGGGGGGGSISEKEKEKIASFSQVFFLCIYILHSCDFLKKMLIKINVVTYEGNSRNEIAH